MVCSICKCVGHNKRTCPTTRLQRTHAAPLTIVTVLPPSEPAEAPEQSQPPWVQRRGKPTKREEKIQEIVFENCQEIPDGVFKQLMDALVM